MTTNVETVARDRALSVNRSASGRSAVHLGTAEWIGPVEDVIAPPGERPAYLLRRSFQRGTADSARLAITAHGVYEAFLNGVRVGDVELAPGFTSYRDRLFVQQYEVADLLVPGENTLVILLSDGWFRGRHGFQRGADGFGPRTGAIARLEDTAAQDANVATVVQTDADWEWRTSHLLRADLMDGEGVDLRLLDDGWFDSSSHDGWRAVATGPAVTDLDDDRLRQDEGAPVRQVRSIPVTGVTRLDDHTAVLDFGEEINGWIVLPDTGAVGNHLTLTYAEVVGPDGHVTQENIRSFSFSTGQMLPAGQRDDVISAGPTRSFEPRHSTRGFRYVEITASDDLPELDGVVAKLVHTELPTVGSFDCDDERLNELHRVVRRSFLTNACGVPTDCPQRERSGFTGDWQIFVETAARMHDVKSFSERWLRDLAVDQWSDGRIPPVIPCPEGSTPTGVPMSDAAAGSAGWGDAAVFVPWELWRAYGDQSALREAYPAMGRWVDFLADQAAAHRHPDRATERPVAAPHERYLVDTGFHFGEWLEPGEEPAPDPSVDHGIVATAYLARSAELTARVANILGDEAAATRYVKLARRTRDAWQTEYVDDDGHLTEERQAHYVRGLAFGLFAEADRVAAAARLGELVLEAGTALSTGFLSTGMLLPTLADAGRADLAEALLLRTEQPSWLGMLKHGATTMWEWWDAIGPDGSVRGSLDHYSKGAVASYLHTHVAGLRLPTSPGPSDAGFKRIEIAPVAPGSLSRASTTHEAPNGTITVRWERHGQDFTLWATIPEGTTASVRLPDGSTREAAHGTHRWACALTAAH